MTSKNCLNCEKELTDNFCSRCGQKADTHRITLKNFIFHDVLHGTLHIEKGILFTAKQALLCPGKAALNYISGRRKRYYNVFYLILITFGLILFLRHFYEELTISKGAVILDDYNNEASKTVNETIYQKSKFIVLLFIPLVALNSLTLFRRKKLNLSEHFIISGMVLLGMLLISAIGNLLFFLTLIIDSDVLANIIGIVTTTLIIFQVIYGYYNAFGTDYSKLGIAYRIVLFFVLFGLEVVILANILVGFVTDWKFDKEVILSPFG
jgi:uncharacterized protein DUF3667